MMKKTILFIFIAFMIGFAALKMPPRNLKEGDVIFQISDSKQAPAIRWATCSVWGHCGVVVFKNNKPYVLEASSTVRLTPLDKFVKKGVWGLTRVRRYTNSPVKIQYQKYLGTKYDLQFSLTNNRYYCSELIYVIYKDQMGIELCKPKPLSRYNTLFLSKVIKRRNISEKSLFVAPCDLL